ncbi:MFS transporter [Burkholderia gladioli]|uniref:MFS transporter n=1 Tax=Burkholderia gladioli TaxID=28095 RepID=UPI001641531A|nr:MFS transporter [Burkholderia gladioli]
MLASAEDRSAAQAVHAARPHRVFFATWAGWTLDGFDNAIYIYVIVAALTDLLPASGYPADHAHIARFGGLMFSLFMLGWACSMLWGWCADRFGRVPAMCATILIYSIFTGACGLAPGIVSFAAFRFLTGFGIGGEWAAGAPLLQESVPERLRERLSGWLHTGTPIGFLLASLTALFVLPHFGWRALFLIGAAPALLTVWLRAGVPESPRWREQRDSGAPLAPWRELFGKGRARTTWCAALMMTCLIFGLWSSTFWIPTLVSTWQAAQGESAQAAQHLGSLSGLIMSVGTLAGCAGMPWIVRAFATRRRAAAFFFSGAAVCNVLAYGLLIMTLKSLALFMCMLPLLGFFTSGVFSLYTIWLPEMFPTMLRALGSGFAFSFGRIVGAVGPVLVGALAAAFRSYPLAITLVSAIYLVGLPLVFLAPETAGRRLRA